MCQPWICCGAVVAALANRAHVHLAINRSRAATRFFFILTRRCVLFSSLLCCAVHVHLSSIYKMWIKKCNLDFWLFFFSLFIRSRNPNAYCTIATQHRFRSFFFIRFLILMLKKKYREIILLHITTYFYLNIILVRFVFFSSPLVESCVLLIHLVTNFTNEIVSIIFCSFSLSLPVSLNAGQFIRI